MLMGKYDSAAEQVQLVIDIDGMYPHAMHADAMLKTLRGQTEEALVAWRTLVRLHPEFTPGLLGHVYSAVAAGRQEEAVRSVQRLSMVVPQRAALYRAVAGALADPTLRGEARALLAASGLAPSEAAAWQVVLGDDSAAIAALKAGYTVHSDADMPFILAHPLMKAVRGDASIRAMITEIGLGFS